MNSTLWLTVRMMRHEYRSHLGVFGVLVLASALFVALFGMMFSDAAAEGAAAAPAMFLTVSFGAAIGVVPVHVLAWRISRHGRHRDEGRDRLVVVAALADVEQLVVDLGMSPERPAVVVGHLLPGEPVGTDLAEHRNERSSR